MAGWRFVRGRIPVELHPERLDQPLRWKKPRRIFVCSLADLFHEDVPDEFIARVFGVMHLVDQHIFQVLTKRPERMRFLLDNPRFWREAGFQPPLPNVWVGVSVENQHWADVRIPLLLETPAAVRWLSCEPLLAPLDLRAWLPQLDWLVLGGESMGPPERALVFKLQERDRHYLPKLEALAWVRLLRDQCIEAGVPFFFKQWPMPPHKPGGPAFVDGHEWRQYP